MSTYVLPRPTNSDIAELTDFRRELHRNPELSGEEADTARRVVAMLEPTSPDRVLTGLGGHGVAAIYDSGKPGLTVMFRSELDALPIEELGDVPHRSLVPGKAHLCGHDGHSTILLGLARLLGRARPPAGKVVLMFQPAEEDGSGAAAVIDDPRYEEIRPDYAFSLHNKPGAPLGSAVLSPGPANCASRGISIRLRGSTAHAAQPETGRSPMRAVARLMPALEECGGRGPLGPDFAMVTVTHSSMGAAVYGVAPGEARILATLRTVTDDAMAALCEKVETLIAETAQAHLLCFDIEYGDIFLACTNDPLATEYLSAGVARAGLPFASLPMPQRGSEDFGRFGHGARSAMLFLGAGENLPQVHTPTYDFPDELIGPGIWLFSETLSACMERG